MITGLKVNVELLIRVLLQRGYQISGSGALFNPLTGREYVVTRQGQVREIR